MKVERDNDPVTTEQPLESGLAPGTVYYFPADPETLFMRTSGGRDGLQACIVLADTIGYPGTLYHVSDRPVVVVDATLRVRG